MKKLCILFFFVVIFFEISAQENFLFDKNVDKVIIPFKFINNLIFIPIKVNGVELNFLLDTGVEVTILFGMENKKEVSLFNLEKINLRGFGSDKPIEGLKSTMNTLEIKGLVSNNHLIYVVLDQGFNLSSHIGIPVNGIIGYDFFKNNFIEINYRKKRIVVYKQLDTNSKKIRKRFSTVDISIDGNKPYTNAEVVIDGIKIPVKLLIDIGNSDAIWLFENKSKAIKIPEKNFEDYLGKGFTGDIEGKRAQISRFTISKFDFNNLIVAFPDTTLVKNAKIVVNRSGSVGSEIFKRFTVLFDYSNKKMFLRKNKDFYAPFSYNKSGIELQQNGLQWVDEMIRLETVPLSGANFDSNGNRISNNFKYKFELKPIYEITNVRKNTSAAISGLQKGDIILRINNILAYKYSLKKINEILNSEAEKWIIFEIERNGQILKIKFKLENIL